MTHVKLTQESKVSIGINLGILICAGLTVLGAFFVGIDQRYAKAAAIDAIHIEINAEAESRKELKGEMDALYLHLIPEAAPVDLRHHETLGH